MAKHKKIQEEKSDWVKMAACPSWYRIANYYAIVRFKGKQIRHCLETDDLELARANKAKFKAELAKTTPNALWPVLSRISKRIKLSEKRHFMTCGNG
jgi:hypothetical protein